MNRTSSVTSSVNLRSDSVPQSESISYFVSSAKRIGKTNVSKKHTFTANEAEKLMKKHLKKKPISVKIHCVEDGMRFIALVPKYQKKLHQRVSYQDIQHIFIYSLNPQLIMLCVADSGKKGKKYYEGFQCDSADDISRLCELTTEAKQSPDGKLHIRTSQNGGYAYEELSIASAEQNYRSIIEQNNGVRSSPEEMDFDQEEKPETPKVFRESIGVSPIELSPLIDREFQQPVQAGPMNYNHRPPSIESFDETENRFHGDILKSPKVTVMSYSCSNLYSGLHPRCLLDYNVEQLNGMFGKKLTYVTDKPNGSELSERGPVYMYAKRVISRASSYHDLSGMRPVSKIIL